MVHIAGVAAPVHIVGIVAHTAYTLVIGTGISHVLESFLKLTTNPHLLPRTGYSTEFIPGMFTTVTKAVLQRQCSLIPLF